MHNPHGPPSSTAPGHGLTPSHLNHPANNISFKSPLLAHLAASSARLPTTADQHQQHHAGTAAASSPRHPGYAPPAHYGGYPTHHQHQPAYMADPHDMSVMSTADISFQSRANASDFMSPLLPRQLQQPATSSSTSSSTPGGPNTASTLADLVAHGTGTLHPTTDRSPTLAHAPLQPVHAPSGSSGNREYEQLMRIYGWQESPTLATQDPFYANPLLAASTVNLSAAAKFNAAYDAPPVPPTPSMAAGVLDAANGKVSQQAAQQDQSGSWTGFLGKFRGKSSKPGTPPAAAAGGSGEPQSRSRQGSASGPSGTGGALAALSSLAKRTVGQEVIPRFGRRGSDSSLNPPPASRFAPLSSASGQPSASARAGGGGGGRGARHDLPDRDDASFTSFTLHGDEPLRSPAVAHLMRLSGGGFGDDSVDEDGNVGNATEYFVHADTTEVVLTPGGAAGYLGGRPEHRRANSDQTVHSVMAMSMSVGPNNHPASTVPGGHATAAAVAALRPATAPTHAQQQQQQQQGVAPAPVPIAMHRSDSGFHMLDSGIHRDSVAAPSMVSGAPSSSAGDRRRQGFATYRLTQAPPLSYDNMDDEAAEDDTEVVIDDDEQPLGATMAHPLYPHAGGGRPVALTVPPRSTSIKPTNSGSGPSQQQPPPLASAPSAMSLTSPSSLDLASGGGNALMSHENSTVLNVSAAQATATAAGEFGLPPSGHPFWTNPRIFDPPTQAKSSAGKSAVPPGEIPPVVWEVSPIDASRKLMAASPVKLIEVLTTTLDYHFLTDFFLVYRSFMSPLQLALMLILRFRWAMMHPDSEEHALVRFRTFIVLRHWITEYYIQDFSGSRPLRYLMIVTFINAIAEDPVIRAHPRDYRLVKTLKRLLRSQDQEYKHLKQLHTQTVGNPMVSDLACWVHQLSVEKHFEAVYYPILMLVKEGNGSGQAASVEDDGHSRDSGIVRSMSGSGPNAFVQQQQQQQQMSSQQQLRGSNMSTGSTNSTIGGPGSIASSSGSSANTAASSDVTGMGVPAALGALVCSKRSFLLTFKIESIADQFMLIEEMMLLSIPWPSLIQHASQAGKAKPLPGSVQEDRGPVQSMIDRFNATCQWVATEVCSQRSMDDRVKVIEKLIRLAVRSQHLGNYSTVNQITLGLQNPYVERLRKTWSKISSIEKRQLRELVTLTAPLKNFSPLRAAMAAELERGGGIPFTGVLLSDLVYNREMPSNLGKTTLQLNNAGIQAQPGMPPIPTSVSLPVINYHKFRVMASTLDQFRQFQKTKRPPGHNALDVAVYANCLCLHTVPNDELQRMSYECERK